MDIIIWAGLGVAVTFCVMSIYNKLQREKNKKMKYDGLEKLGLGTPRTLDHAIYQALYLMNPNHIEENLYQVFRDFSAQKVGVQMLAAKNKSEEDLIMDLFIKLVHRESA